MVTSGFMLHLFFTGWILTQSLFAQQDWQALGRAPAGQSITVYQQKNSDSGKLVRLTGSALIYSTKKGDVSVPASDVTKVTVPGHKRLRNAIIFGAVGFGIGAILSSTVGTRFYNEGTDIRAPLAVIPGVAGVGLGALMRGSDTVYRRPGK